MSGLTAAQQDAAGQIYNSALMYGLSPQRAVELIGVSYAESGLDTTNYYGKSSGQPWEGEGKQAAGLFQLLSPGYIAKAEAIGRVAGDAPGQAVFDPQANINAILPSYVSYFRSNPNAAIGAAGANVEASGETASWYAGGEQAFLDKAGFGSVDAAIKFFGGASSGTVVPVLLPGQKQVDTAVNKAKDVGGAFSSLEDAFNFIFSYRFLEILGGGALIIIGLVGLMREVGVKSPTLPGPAGKIANSGGS